MSIETKREQITTNNNIIAENTQKVFSAGQKSFADAIPTMSTTVGTNKRYLRIDDISEVPHDVTIFNPQYSDDTYVYGKNLLDEDIYNIDKWDNYDTNRYRYYLGLPEGTYTFSAKCKEGILPALYIETSEDEWGTATTTYWLTPNEKAPITIQVKSNTQVALWANGGTATLIKNKEIYDIQTEWGSIATEYEPYKRQYVATPYDDEKQMHIGVAKSFYPTITISGYYDDLGVNATYNKSYGKQVAYDAFWDAYQVNGTRGNYNHAFGGSGWTNKTFKPKYDICPIGTGSYMMFRDSSIEGDMVQILKDCGVEMDFSKSSGWVSYVFSQARYITRLGKLDFHNASEMYDIFGNCTRLQTIDLLIVSPQCGFTTTFSNCSALENITFDGEIGKNINFSYSPKLTHTSLMSIINHLKDYNGSGTTYTLTLGATNLAKLNPEDIALGQDKGWTIV